MHFSRHFPTALALLGALALSAPSLSAHEFKAGDLQIGHPWTRATPTGASTAAGYVKITNNGKETDTLLGASAEEADKVEIHEMTMENDVMKMRQRKDGVPIKPGETIELKPGALHLMVIGVKAPFKQGAMVKGTLTFANAGTVPVEFKVEAIGSSAPAAGTANHQGGH